MKPEMTTPGSTCEVAAGDFVALPGTAARRLPVGRPAGFNPLRTLYAFLLMHFGRPVQTSRRMLPVLRLPSGLVVLPAIMLLALALLVACEPAHAADELFGSGSPLVKFVDFISGPFAYGVTISALVLTVGALMFGGEFSGFGRRMPIVVVAGAIVILAGTVIKNLFGADRAAQWPVDGSLEQASGSLHALSAESAPFSPLPDVLMQPLLSWPAWLLIAGFLVMAVTAGMLSNRRCDALNGRSPAALKRRRSGRARDLVLAGEPLVMDQPEADA